MRNGGGSRSGRFRVPAAAVVAVAAGVLLTGCRPGDLFATVGASGAAPDGATSQAAPVPPSPTEMPSAPATAPAADGSAAPLAAGTAPTPTSSPSLDSGAATSSAGPSAPVVAGPTTSPAGTDGGQLVCFPAPDVPTPAPGPVPVAPGSPVTAPDPSPTDQPTPTPLPSNTVDPAPSTTSSPSATSTPSPSTRTPLPTLSPPPPGQVQPGPGESKDWAVYPFRPDSPANRPIPAGATFEGSGGAMSSDLKNGSGTNVNSQSWSFAFYTARSSDPVVQVRDPGSGSVKATIHLPADATTTGGTDDHMGVVQPDGYTAYEFYKMHRSGSGWTSPYVVVTDLRGDGLSGGTRAAGTSIFWGVIRAQELQQASIRHTLLLGIPASALKSGQVWPARLQDRLASRYSGSVPMGTLFAIPPSTDVESLGLDREGLALARALQRYGAYVMIQSASTALYAEKDADQSQVAALKGPWQRLRPLLRAVTNNRP